MTGAGGRRADLTDRGEIFGRLALVCTLGWATPSACRDDARSVSARTDASPAPDRSPALRPGPVVEPPPAPPVRSDGTVFGDSELMGTRVSINVYLPDPTKAAEAGRAMQTALEEMARIEQSMSEWRQGSELSALNRSAGEAGIEISHELFEVLARSKEISEATAGAFDVTFHGVGQLWTFTPGSRPPSPELVAAKLPLVDWTGIELEPASDGSRPRARLVRPGMMIGLGGIAKGYAVDRASASLRASGFPDHLVEAGGDTYASGSKGGTAWRIGVQDPGHAGAIGSMAVTDVAIVTSGNYQRYFEFEGTRYAHILDPRTGWPVDAARSPRSVTVVGARAADADAFCTALAVMGSEAGMAFVETRRDLDAILIDHDGTVLVSSGLRDAFERIARER
jgi:FAD:protein FMN transferase